MIAPNMPVKRATDRTNRVPLSAKVLAEDLEEIEKAIAEQPLLDNPSNATAHIIHEWAERRRQERQHKPARR